MTRKEDEDKARLIIDRMLLDDEIRKYMHIIKDYSKSLFHHCCNVAFIAAQICYDAGYPDCLIEDIVVGALLHDIGKTKIPLSIIEKNGPLSKKEYELIKKHPAMGYEMIKDAGFSAITKDIVLHHHENEVGSGYPDGSTCMDYETKIVAIADKYDGISSSRAYHPIPPSFYKSFVTIQSFCSQYGYAEQIYTSMYRCKGL